MTRIVLLVAVLVLAACKPDSRTDILAGEVVKIEFDPEVTCHGTASVWHKANPKPCKPKPKEWEIAIRGPNGYGQIVVREFEFAYRPLIWNRLRLGQYVRASDLR